MGGRTQEDMAKEQYKSWPYQRNRSMSTRQLGSPLVGVRRNWRSTHCSRLAFCCSHGVMKGSTSSATRAGSAVKIGSQRQLISEVQPRGSRKPRDTVSRLGNNQCLVKVEFLTRSRAISLCSHRAQFQALDQRDRLSQHKSSLNSKKISR